MKIFIYILIVLALGVVSYNVTRLNFDHLFQGDSSIASVSILSGLCAILVLWILLISRKIGSKLKK